jgi:hypothetical protein
MEVFRQFGHLDARLLFEDAQNHQPAFIGGQVLQVLAVLSQCAAFTGMCRLRPIVDICVSLAMLSWEI